MEIWIIILVALFIPLLVLVVGISKIAKDNPIVEDFTEDHKDISEPVHLIIKALERRISTFKVDVDEEEEEEFQYGTIYQTVTLDGQTREHLGKTKRKIYTITDRVTGLSFKTFGHRRNQPVHTLTGPFELTKEEKIALQEAFYKARDERLTRIKTYKNNKQRNKYTKLYTQTEGE